MPDRVYIRPIALAASPQAEDGAVRLGGGLVWASRFALFCRREGVVTAREVVSARDMPAADVEKAALAEDGVRRILNGKAPRKVIVVPNRIVNVVA